MQERIVYDPFTGVSTLLEILVIARYGSKIVVARKFQPFLRFWRAVPSPAWPCKICSFVSTLLEILEVYHVEHVVQLVHRVSTLLEILGLVYSVFVGF